MFCQIINIDSHYSSLFRIKNFFLQNKLTKISYYLFIQFLHLVFRLLNGNSFSGFMLKDIYWVNVHIYQLHEKMHYCD